MPLFPLLSCQETCCVSTADEESKLTSRRVEWHVKEGEAFEPVKHVATVRGPVRKILLGERVALNTLARCSGIATKCVTIFLLCLRWVHL